VLSAEEKQNCWAGLLGRLRFRAIFTWLFGHRSLIIELVGYFGYPGASLLGYLVTLSPGYRGILQT